MTLADGTNVKLPGGVHTKILAELVDEYVTVSENEIASYPPRLVNYNLYDCGKHNCSLDGKFTYYFRGSWLLGYSTAYWLFYPNFIVGLAALLHKKIQVRKDEKVCVVICGGNIDMSTLRQIYEYGLRSLGRYYIII